MIFNDNVPPCAAVLRPLLILTLVADKCVVFFVSFHSYFVYTLICSVINRLNTPTQMFSLVIMLFNLFGVD